MKRCFVKVPENHREVSKFLSDYWNGREVVVLHPKHWEPDDHCEVLWLWIRCEDGEHHHLPESWLVWE